MGTKKMEIEKVIKELDQLHNELVEQRDMLSNKGGQNEVIRMGLERRIEEVCRVAANLNSAYDQAWNLIKHRL